ncbi:aminotransferase class I/II-fold pyridoxal phosphate-dependent enzyme [Schaalia sp. 19OD2882]|uniref:aminotransferase class I/II-fold pyridoxal phosphate-dependent enzyme n=1 Tax=Schaalia sp. 19OD2882 TaxID=2794089 RepID=UPI0020A6F0E0|nr:aminotransferase class I/II-fold pyridoxal phosphate-dependent enzyme [Schaalia sp. 19OD2882]
MRPSARGAAVDTFHAMAVATRAGQLQAEGADVIRLSLGEPDSGAPPRVLDALRQVADGRPLPYTDAMGLPALRAAIAQRYADVHGVHVDPRRICVTSGASAALLLLSAALVDPGDHVMLGDPSYPCNRQFLAAFGAQVDLVATSAETRYQLDLNLVQDHWRPDTRGILIATPSNPTGTRVPEEELRQICGHAAGNGAWRVIDEIYLALSDDVDRRLPRTALALDPGAVVLSSFSKYFGMTGWRLGWTVVPEELVDVIERLAQNLFICAPTPAQMAALECFHPESLQWCEQRRALFAQRRRVAAEELERIGVPVPVRPDGAFYVYMDVSGTGMDADEFCRRALEEHHVALTPGRDFGPLTARTHVRLSCAASTQDIMRGVARVGEMLSRP